MQEQQPQSTTGTRNAASTPKPAKNLYDPYVTPGWFWVALRAVARAIFFLILNVKLVGRQNIPEQGPFIVASNHLDWTDIPLVPAYMDQRVIYLAKEELFQGRLSWLVRFLGAIPVKRGEADRQLLRSSDELLKKGKVLIIFPEGTRSKIQQMAQAHAGLGMIALRSGAPVLPVAISGSEHALKKFRPRVTISYGEPLVVKPKGSKVTRDDVNDATELIMRRVAAMLPEAYRGFYNEQKAPELDTANPEPF